MAKRAIEEEFDRIYYEFIENPLALPRLKKRVKTCRYPDEKTCRYPDEKTCGYPDDKTCRYLDENTCGYPDDKTCRYPDDKTYRYPDDKTCRYPDEKTYRYPDEKTCRYPDDKTCGYPDDKTCGYPDDKTCIYPDDKTCSYPDASCHAISNMCVSENTGGDVISTEASSPISFRSTSFSATPEKVSHHSQDLQVCLHKPSTYDSLPTGNLTIDEDDSKAVSTTILPSQWSMTLNSNEVIQDVTKPLHREEESLNTNELFMLHKPRINRGSSTAIQKCLNLDMLWSVYAKTWLLLRLIDRSQHRPAVFLNRNLQRGKKFFKQYLKQREIVSHSSGSKPSSLTQEPAFTMSHTAPYPSSKDSAVTKTVTGKSCAYYSKQETKKIKSTELNKTQKRKERKPKVQISKLLKETKDKTSSRGLTRSKQVGASHKSEKLSIKMRLTHKQVLKTDDVVEKSLSTTSNKKMWTKEHNGGRQIAICRPNTTKEMPNQDMARNSKYNLDVHVHPVCQRDSTQCLENRPGVHQHEAEENSLDVTGTPDIESGVKPLFTGQSGHCGGIWKSIVDES